MNFLPEGVSFNKNITYLAKTNFRNQEQVFGIKRKDRRQHMYVLGKSGSGKSALLGNMIVQNIWNGEGVCVVDPHGELVESILATIPEHRVKDVVYFNPADSDFHIGFNVLQLDDPKYKHLVASGLMGIFTKIWANSWSARMEYILNNAILALLDTPGSTLLGIPRLLVDKDYRQTIVNNLKDPVIKAFWVHEYETWREQYRNEAIAPIQNKVGQFLSTSIIRNVVGQADSTINLFNIMNEGKIFLVNVSKGRIGEDNSALLGGMLITKLQLAAMERVRIAEEDRKDFYLYVDEFQNFVTDSFASILSEARKYRLNLTLAHQYIAQLVTKESEAVRDAVFGNVGTMIIFRVGAADADFLEKEFEPEFMVQDMVNLPNYNVYLKLMVDGVTSRPFSARTLPPFQTPVNSNVTDTIIESSRKLYARPREVVEKEINVWTGMLGSAELTEGKFKAICSSCGKETTVPFEPQPGRPVYCKDCIAKIKSGEMKPLSGTRPKELEPQSFAPLAGLGIEFAQTSSAPRPASQPVRPATSARPTVSFTPRPMQKAMATAVAKHAVRPVQTAPAITNTAPRPMHVPQAVAPKPVSMQSSQATERPKNFRTPKERSGPDHVGLKNVLAEALGDALKTVTIPPAAKKEVESAPLPEKKTISLSSLKKPEATSAPKMAPKIASEEHISALQEVIAKARASQVADLAKKSVQSKPEQSEAKEIPAKEPEAVKEEAPEANSSEKEHHEGKKKVREVPEDVLKRVLADE
jgi:CxxC-x17-CxxC domain-containing protein